MNPVAITLVVRLLVGVSTPSCGVAIHCILKHTKKVARYHHNDHMTDNAAAGS